VAERTDPVEGSDAVTSTAGPRRRVWWIGPRAGVLAITAGLLGVVVLAWARGLAGIHEVVSSPRLAWWALVPLFVVAEVVVVHVQVRREAQAVSLSEIPLVLALFLTTPS